MLRWSASATPSPTSSDGRRWARAAAETRGGPTGLTGYALAGVDNDWGDIDDPFSFPGNIPLTFLHRVWSVTERWASQSNPEDVHPIQLAGVLTPLQANDDLDNNDLGRAWFNPHYAFAGGVVVRTQPASGEPSSPLAVGYRLAHEVGHTHGLDHDPTMTGDYTSFMAFDGGTAPILGNGVPSYIPMKSNVQAWQDPAPKKSSPRPPGFAFVECDKVTNPCPARLTCTSQTQGALCLP